MKPNLEIISDLIYRIPKTNLELKIETHRGYKTSTGGRTEKTFISTYNSKKYTNSDSLRSVKLGSSDYLVFEILRTEENKKNNIRFMISYPNWYEMVNTFKQIRLYINKKFQEIYFYDESNNICINEAYSKDFEISNNTVADNGILFLRFDLKETNNVTLEPAVVIIIDGNAEFISIDDFIELTYHIENINLKEASNQLHIRALLEYQYQIANGILYSNDSSSVTKTPPKKKGL